MPPRTIRLVPNLSIAALKHGLNKELSLWYCLRDINYWGSGHLELQMATEALALHFHYSKSTAYRIQIGEGLKKLEGDDNGKKSLENKYKPNQEYRAST